MARRFRWLILTSLLIVGAVLGSAIWVKSTIAGPPKPKLVSLEGHVRYYPATQTWLGYQTPTTHGAGQCYEIREEQCDALLRNVKAELEAQGFWVRLIPGDLDAYRDDYQVSIIRQLTNDTFRNAEGKRADPSKADWLTVFQNARRQGLANWFENFCRAHSS